MRAIKFSIQDKNKGIVRADTFKPLLTINIVFTFHQKISDSFLFVTQLWSCFETNEDQVEKLLGTFPPTSLIH